MKTKTAAPPRIPPRRPIVGIALADAHDWRARHEDLARQLDVCRAILEDIRALTQANRARLRASLQRLQDRDQPDA